MKSILFSSMIFLSIFSISVYADSNTLPVNKRMKQTVQVVNLNTANVASLIQAYKGFGQRRAKAIVAYRSKCGPFHSVGELSNIKQVGNAYVKRHLKELEKTFSVK